MIDFCAHYGLNNPAEYIKCNNSKFFEKTPCKNEDFWSKIAKNDQILVILTFDSIFQMNLDQIGSMD